MRGKAERPLLFLAFKRAHHALSTHASAVVGAAVGTPGAQVAALVQLDREDGIMIRELGARLGLESAGTTGLVARLERQGLARRTPEKRDRRAVRIHITPKGRRTVERAAPILGELSRQMTEGFTAAQVAVVRRFLDHVLTTFELEVT
jgi:MarR family transcriptional regulator, organic hydroperoxide resistance regulator